LWMVDRLFGRNKRRYFLVAKTGRGKLVIDEVMWMLYFSWGWFLCFLNFAFYVWPLKMRLLHGLKTLGNMHPVLEYGI
jgi:hypothetical protein